VNKAEEQYLYNLQRAEGLVFAMQEGYSYKRSEGFIKELRLSLRTKASVFIANDAYRGAIDYLATIIHAIDFGTIKDWPSFVEYMTGEDYEQKPKCEYCNDTKEVPAPHYSSKGDIPDCDFVKCPKCGGDDE